MRAILMAAVLAAACSGPAGDDAPDVDGGVAIDAEACFAVTASRSISCRKVCGTEATIDGLGQLCGGAGWHDCLIECQTGTPVAAWCP